MPEASMETTENTENPTENTDTPTPPAPTGGEVETATAAEPGDATADTSLGRLTPEEQRALTTIKAESQQILAKIGEHEVLKTRLMARFEALDQQGQQHINAITQRLGLSEGQNWVALADGTIRVVNAPAPGQNGQGGASAPPG